MVHKTRCETRSPRCLARRLARRLSRRFAGLRGSEVSLYPWVVGSRAKGASSGGEGHPNVSRVDSAGGPCSEGGVRPGPRARHARRAMASPRRQSRGGRGAEASRASLAPSPARGAIARTPAVLLVPGGRLALGSGEHLPRTVLGPLSLLLPGVVHLRDVMLHHRDDHGGGGYARDHAPHRVAPWCAARAVTIPTFYLRVRAPKLGRPVKI
jgi:hypothetical protein